LRRPSISPGGMRYKPFCSTLVDYRFGPQIRFSQSSIYSSSDTIKSVRKGSELPFEHLFKMADWVNNCPNDPEYGPAAYPLKAAIHILQHQPNATYRRVICGPIALAGTRALKTTRHTKLFPYRRGFE